MSANDGIVNVWDWLLDYLSIMVNGIHGCYGFAMLVIFFAERLDLLQLDWVLGWFLNYLDVAIYQGYKLKSD